MMDGHLLYLLHVKFSSEEGLVTLRVAHGVFVDGEDLDMSGVTL